MKNTVDSLLFEGETKIRSNYGSSNFGKLQFWEITC